MSGEQSGSAARGQGDRPAGRGSARWRALYAQVPLSEVPRHYANIAHSPFQLEYLTEVLRRCPLGGRTLELGVGSGCGPVWLSRRGVVARGLDNVPELVERARAVNALLDGRATFALGDLFELYKAGDPRYDVIHHQGVLEHFTTAQIRVALAQQVASAQVVVFSVPSAWYPYEPEFGDERLLTDGDWREILAPFDVAELRCYGDPALGAREHVLAVLRGQSAKAVATWLSPSREDYLDGVSAIVHTRNEATRLGDCLRSLEGWTDEVIVCDMESTDGTPELARSLGAVVTTHPQVQHFDRARNASAMWARYRWVFYLDADERVPPALGQALRGLLQQRGDEFEALVLPMRHHFCGQWLRCLYPGYTSPRLFRNGRFHFNPRLHAGAVVDGRVRPFPADNPDLAITHYSYDSLSHYLDKLNRYTDGEAAGAWRDGQGFAWQQAVGGFVRDFRAYYDERGAGGDGVLGFLYSFLSGFYRFEQHAKLYERRRQAGQLTPAEEAVPGSVEEVLAYALAVARERPRPTATAVRVGDAGASMVWCGPLRDSSGYGEESRQFALGLAEAGAELAVQILPWPDEHALAAPADMQRLAALTAVPVRRGFAQLVQDFPPSWRRHPDAGLMIGRTMFETDRLPAAWVDACREADAVWVPSAFNQRTFADAGVPADKLAVIPGCLDPAPYRALPPRGARPSGPCSFLSVFDWTLHKGWDVLLRAFLEAFEGVDDVTLTLKVWSTLGYSAAAIEQQATDWARATLGHDLAADARVRFLHARLTPAQLLDCYAGADALVLPSRGEGWGRPYLEAMACGLPVVGTRWSGNTAFMDDANSYLVDAEVVAVPERGWRESPTYRGHRWAEPDLGQLKTALQRVVAEPGEAARLGAHAREEVLARYDRRQVAQLIVSELYRLSESHRPEPAAAVPAPAVRLRWEGALFSQHSLAHVNRALTGGLLQRGVELALVPTEPTHIAPETQPGWGALAERAFAPLTGPAQVHVRHCFPPRLEPPDEGQLVLIQPWEYGYLPRAWVPPIVSHVAEVWCYSDYVRRVYADSGVPAERLHVVPLGVDTAVFRPEAPPWIPTPEPGAARWRDRGRRPFVFCFVGGTIERKGIDILLDAWRRAFTSLDDVLLLVKDTGSQTVYRGQHQAERIRAMADDPSLAPLVYLDAELPEHQLAGVYTAADCLVMPYRGEGFLLPALEALACGRPVVVPAGGPTDDFVDERVGWRLEAQRKPLDPPAVGPWELAGPGWLFETPPDELARLLRTIAADPAEARRRGEAGRERAADWTWGHAVTKLHERLKALALQPPRVRVVPVTNPRGRRGVKGAPRTLRLSLCMIVRNEERVLADCLSSIQPFVDELIVVDTGSTDRTVAIAEEHGARVYHFPWCDDFSAARNESLRHATGDWILWMDADDVIPEACGRRLRDVALQAEESTFGLLLQVHCPPPPGETGLTVVDHVKLFRNRPDLRFEGRIHEQILEAIHRAGGTAARTDLYVVHAGYDHSPEGQARKRERDLKLLELDLAERPDHPFVLFNIGMTAFHMKDWPKATAALERCLAVSGPRESTLRKVYAMLAGCALETRDLARARQWLDRGLGQYPQDPELLFRLGLVAREQGDLGTAEQAYLRLLTEREAGHIDSLDVTMTGFKAHHNLGMVYQDLGRLDRAEAAFRAAVAAEPGFGPSWLGLRETLARLGRWDEARAADERLSRLTGGAPPSLADSRRRSDTTASDTQ